MLGDHGVQHLDDDLPADSESIRNLRRWLLDRLPESGPTDSGKIGLLRCGETRSGPVFAGELRWRLPSEGRVASSLVIEASPLLDLAPGVGQ